MTVSTEIAVRTFDRVLCGIDRSAESLEAARQAARLRAPGGTLQLAGVVDVGAAVHAGAASSHALAQLDAAAFEALRRAQAEVHATSTRLVAGGVAPTLLDELEREKATLAAVGPHGHSRGLGMLLGGIAAELLHNAPCSVLLARTPRFGEFPSSIIAGVDGSAESLAAADVAESIAARFGSELVIVVATGGKEIDLEPIEARWPLFVSDPDHPVESLSDLSNEVDLLVVGSRGLHGLRALGSVSERVAHRAASSVLVVRNPKEKR
jgi:nucleotide-binding universal stress UspA family protein